VLRILFFDIFSVERRCLSPPAFMINIRHPFSAYMNIEKRKSLARSGMWVNTHFPTGPKVIFGKGMSQCGVWMNCVRVLV